MHRCGPVLTSTLLAVVSAELRYRRRVVCHRQLMEGRPALPGEDNEVGVIAAGPGWFETIGVGLVEGRYLSERDAADAPAVAVVNGRLARHFFGSTPHRSAGVCCFHVGGDRPQVREIVGVVRDAKHYGVKGRDWPMVFIPTLRDGNFLVRTQTEISGIADTIRAVVAASGGHRASRADTPLPGGA